MVSDSDHIPLTPEEVDACIAGWRERRAARPAHVQLSPREIRARSSRFEIQERARQIEDAYWVAVRRARGTEPLSEPCFTALLAGWVYDGPRGVATFVIRPGDRPPVREHHNFTIRCRNAAGALVLYKRKEDGVVVARLLNWPAAAVQGFWDDVAAEATTS